MLLVLVSQPKVIVAVVPVVRWLPRADAWFGQRRIGLEGGHFSQMLIVRLLDEVKPETGDEVQVDEEQKVVVEDLEQDLRRLLNIALIDQLVDSQYAVHLQDADHVQDDAGGLRVVEEREHINPETYRGDVMPKYFLRALDLLAEAVNVRRPQVYDDIGDVQEISEEVDVAIGGIEHGLVYFDAHGDEDDGVDSDEDDQVGPALAPWVIAGDEEPVLLLVLYLQGLPLLLLFLLQVLNHHLNRRLAVREVLLLRLLDHLLELLLLILAQLLESELLTVELVLPVVDFEHFVALRTGRSCRGLARVVTFIVSF